MLSDNRTAANVEQLLEFTARLRQMLQWAEKTLTCVSQAAGLAAQRKCCHDHQKSPGNTENDPPGQTIADPTTFCARWGGKSRYLGDTLPFRLLERLARRPDQLFRYDLLLHDVWTKRSREAVRAWSKSFAKSSGPRAWMIWQKPSTGTRPVIMA